MLDYVMRLGEMGGVSGLLAELDEQVLSPRQLARPALPAGGLAEIEKRAAACFTAERWDEALIWYGELCRIAAPTVDWRKVLLAIGRCLLYLDDHLSALAVFERLAPLQPADSTPSSISAGLASCCTGTGPRSRPSRVLTCS